ncbi:MAG: hypothetical protein ACTHJI_19200 [Leifsonia sp.]
MMADPERDELEQHMVALDEGLRRIAHSYRRDVMLSEEDPEVFGAGHYVLYPERGTDTRFAIEEQYTHTDWSDPDRVPTSWTWSDQRRGRFPDGSHGWIIRAEGEYPSRQVDRLLERAETWARNTSHSARRAESLDLMNSAAPTRRPPSGPVL